MSGIILSVFCGFLGGLGTGEILLIALVVLLLFGGKKIPELMRGIGKGVKSFKEGMDGIEEDMHKQNKTEPTKDPGKEQDKPQEKAG
ncbi:MAG: twin-arginine translocase TatA/TatE family subunit [Bacteroidetes bacterium]|nr:twin-arginine translocase TatA/TatE family subunit [Bacteroidota bacterium]